MARNLTGDIRIIRRSNHTARLVSLFSIPKFIHHVTWIAYYVVCRVALLIQ